MAFVSKVGETMYMHQALKEPDKAEFMKAMAKEITTHERRIHWKSCLILYVPKGAQVLGSM